MSLGTIVRSALTATLLAAFGCHRFQACGGGVSCESEPGEASGGDGGHGGRESGTGGIAGNPPAGCAGTLANCDDSSLNGCETDLASSPRHCSGCNVPCAGICNQGECVPFDVVADNQANPQGGIALTTDYAYFAAGPDIAGEANLRVQRIARSNVSDRLAYADGQWSSIEAIAATSQRLYLLANSDLWSMNLDATDLRVAMPEVNAIDANGRFLYWVSWPIVYQWEENAQGSAVALDLAGASVAHIVATGTGVFVFTERYEADGPTSYEVTFVSEDLTERLQVAAGEGSIRLAAGYGDEAYFVVEHGRTSTLEFASPFAEAATLSSNARGIVDLAASSASTVASVTTTFSSSLRVFGDPGTGLVIDLPTPSPVLALEADPNGELWFFDQSSAALVRVYPFIVPQRP